MENDLRVIKRRVTHPLLVVDPKACTACRICQLICSFFHDKVFDPSRARIEVVRAGRPELDYAFSCRQCSKAPCAQACPTEAIRRESGIVIVSEDKCFGCGECVQACPYGSMKLHPARQVAIKCDLCGQCVRYCPPNAMKIVDINEVATEKNNATAEKLAEIELNRAEE